MSFGRRRPLTRLGLNRALRAWHGAAGRALPARDARSPWEVLVVEVMSQQTQIGRVGAAWRRFVERWPAPADLATADTRELLAMWAGLGYNRRALALRDAARAIVRDHGGTVPSGVAGLAELPGVGPYTARAVAAVAFGTPVAPLDVNVRRVMGRLLGGDRPTPQLQAAADALVSRTDARGWVNAVMDLAATTCTRRSPRCSSCPVRNLCASRGTAGEGHAAEGRSADSPTRTPFPATNRWLRGRLLAIVRDAPAGSWTDVPASLGTHDGTAVIDALGGLERDGFLEVRDGRVRLTGSP